MAQNSNYTAAKNESDTGSNQIKHYGNSSYVAKKTEEARKTLKKFPVLEKYCK